MGKNIWYVSKPVKNQLTHLDAKRLALGGKHDPTGDQDGGAVVVGGPALRALDFDIEAFGRVGIYEEGEETPFESLARQLGIVWHIEKVAVPGKVCVVIPGPPVNVIRAVRGPKYLPSPAEGAYLAQHRPDAIAIAGSLENEANAFWLTSAAAKGIVAYWNPSQLADLSLADCGGVVYLQVSYSEFKSPEFADPANMAQKLLARTGAAGVLVTNGTDGTYGVLRGTGVQHCPAIPVDGVVELGAGDAHFAGVIAALQSLRGAEPSQQLDRALTLGRLTSARHVLGLRPGDWTAIRNFEASLDRIPPIRKAG